MTATQVARKGAQQIARPLKVLVPLIQTELEEGDQAGHEHYRRAGELLIEAKDQLEHGAFGKWLSKNFALSHSQANLYMRWARAHFEAPGHTVQHASLSEMRGKTERTREQRQAEHKFRKTLREVARDEFAQERKTVDQEIALHRELAEELIDLGFRALSMRLHPDRGGSKDAMRRLNRVRDELKQIAKTRRFVECHRT